MDHSYSWILGFYVNFPFYLHFTGKKKLEFREVLWLGHIKNQLGTSHGLINGTR